MSDYDAQQLLTALEHVAHQLELLEQALVHELTAPVTGYYDAIVQRYGVLVEGRQVLEQLRRLHQDSQHLAGAFSMALAGSPRPEGPGDHAGTATDAGQAESKDSAEAPSVAPESAEEHHESALPPSAAPYDNPPPPAGEEPAPGTEPWLLGSRDQEQGDQPVQFL